MKGNIILIGFMGSGKTSVGRRLAKKSGMEFLDTDWEIEKEQQCKISEIFNKQGEAAFRDMETDLLKRLLNRQNNAVISVGGGLPVQEQNQEYLKKLGTVIYLKASEESLWNRLKNDTTRPLLQGGNGREKIHKLMEQREAIYEKTADRIIETDGFDPDGVAEVILNKILGSDRT